MRNHRRMLVILYLGLYVSLSALAMFSMLGCEFNEYEGRGHGEHGERFEGHR